MRSLSDVQTQSRKLTRRDFLKLIGKGGLLAAGGVAWGYYIEPYLVAVDHIPLRLPRLGSAFSGMRIAQMSDIHLGGWMTRERLQTVVDLLERQNPDVLLITGDYLVGRVFNAEMEEHLQTMVDLFAPLAKKFPLFGVFGNHDHWINPGAVLEMHRAAHITDLTNTVFTVERDNDLLHLCGLDDLWAGAPDFEAVLAKRPAEGAAVLLVHEPDFADQSAATGKFDLQVSGHTHGGQVVVPLYGAPLLPYLGKKYYSGLYRVGEMFQYTNRGVGMINPPVRFNCPPEITVFTLEGGA